MHEIRIAELELRNFKGVGAFTLGAHGLNVDVLGDNATGKTTLADAFSWLLFNVDTAGRAEFDIKTLDAGEPIHNLEHEVRAELILTGAVRLELRKVYKEKWTKRRGEASKSFTGHTTDHYVDGVPVKKAEYEARVSELAELAAFRLLTDPAYFSEGLHWQERRGVLLDVCGDITDADVIAANEQLEDLPGILGKRSIEDAGKVIKARRAEVNKELERIPVRIDEARRTIPEEAGDEAEVRAELEAARLALSELDAERVSKAEGGAVAAAKEALALARAELLEAETEAKREAGGRIEELERDERLYRSTATTLGQEVAKATDLVSHTEAQLEAFAKRRDDLRASWDLIDSEQYPDLEELDEGTYIHELAILLEAAKAEPEGECPTCRQPLPESMVEEASARALARFNTAKAERLEDLSAEGKKVASRIATIEDEELPSLRAELETAESNHAGALEALEQAKERTKAASEAPGDAQTSEAAAEARQGLEAAEAAEAAARDGVAAQLEKLDGLIKDAKARVDAAQAAVTAVEAKARGEDRVAELERQEEDLGAELERLERELYLLETFTRSKVEVLEERINSKFRWARFKLFRVLVNGALEECAETLCDGVPWSSANHGARVQVGLDIINTLQAHYGIAPPVWLDQSESVTTLPPMDAQLVRLVVSASDAELRIEAHTAATDAADN